VPQVVAARAGAVVAEPDRAIRLHHNVIGTGEPLALETVGEQGDGAIIFGAGEVLRVVLAGDQPPLAVTRVAIGVVRLLTKHADTGVGFVPPQDAVAGDVAEQQIAAVAEPHRALGETEAGGDPLDRRVAEHQPLEARIEHDDVGIRIAYRRHPFPARSAAA
jgi:hypothetical protein